MINECCFILGKTTQVHLVGMKCTHYSNSIGNRYLIFKYPDQGKYVFPIFFKAKIININRNFNIKKYDILYVIRLHCKAHKKLTFLMTELYTIKTSYNLSIYTIYMHTYLIYARYKLKTEICNAYAGIEQIIINYLSFD